MTTNAKISKAILNLFGWKVVGEKPKYKKFVFMAAPHTSNWDFPIGRLSSTVMGIENKVLMKKSWFFFPLGYIFRWLGAMPIDRSKSGTVIDHILGLFKENESFVFAITPEGTRSYVEYWKTGFYTIAQKANVPIVMGYIDFKKKVTGIGPVIIPSGDKDADFKKILDFYKNVTARHPELYNQNPRFGR